MIFGEYIPFFDWLPRFREWFPETSQWERGDGIQPFLFRHTDRRTSEQRSFVLAPLICYEDIIPSFVLKYAPHAPHLLVNITNDAWFGKTAEPYQHLQLAVFRSVEHRRDMVRAVNTGISTFVSATGEVYKQGPVIDAIREQAAPIYLFDRVAMLSGRTVYSVVGDLFAYLCCATLAFLLWRARAPGHARPGVTTIW
jgi:apolipoprotein N-acyltransferase